jgi:hypothetical protein
MATKPTVYIETTVISYLTARPSRDVVRAARQKITRDWWENQRKAFELYTSEFVVIEAEAGDRAAARRRIEKLRELPLLRITEQALDLADELVKAAAIPLVAHRDAQHVAVAAVNEMEFLLTWNCTHLANVMLRDNIKTTCEKAGFAAPKICRPEELIGE